MTASRIAIGRATRQGFYEGVLTTRSCDACGISDTSLLSIVPRGEESVPQLINRNLAWEEFTSLLLVSPALCRNCQELENPGGIHVDLHTVSDEELQAWSSLAKSFGSEHIAKLLARELRDRDVERAAVSPAQGTQEGDQL